jgi:hypothetical protein
MGTGEKLFVEDLAAPAAAMKYPIRHVPTGRGDA